MPDATPIPDSGLIRILNPEQAIYRIFPLWFLEEAVRLKQLTLVQPDDWEDPYELLSRNVMVVEELDGKFTSKMLDPWLKPVFAQCWSRTAESDTLLRAYSRVVKDKHFGRNLFPREEGVIVKSTPAKLLAAMEAWAAKRGVRGYFVGAVRYGTDDQIQQVVANFAQRRDSVLGESLNQAELCLMKRLRFQEEREVRMIYVDMSRAETKLVRIPIDPTALFDDISFDPRLVAFERKERETTLRRVGYNGPFSESVAYVPVLLEVPISSPPQLSSAPALGEPAGGGMLPPKTEKATS